MCVCIYACMHRVKSILKDNNLNFALTTVV